METIINEEGYRLVRDFQVSVADASGFGVETLGADELHTGVRITIDESAHMGVGRRLGTYNYISMPGAKTVLTLTELELDYLIERLQMAKSLRGSDFLIFGHLDQYRQNGTDYDFDGNEIEEED